ncbi:N utilization substance protein A [Methanohalophilus levihalophilus]|uniref:NusA-like transcription termination signal-binding factor n=1 Tax=Methanohalophilus levihalophilus TaxID=1431282 RepID=UPI001AEB5363|nr:NusA-like transcription termination signal-binding factor [Methanohalophilus levihalophilus]MBP2030479.1 N utilization substance protein A [Methanohalophilus levihalophilus]
MSDIKLSTDAIRYIALFESMTGASIKDCLVDEGRLVYVVKNGDMGAAIGRHGDHINRFKKAVDRHIDLIEYSEDPVTFVKNAFGTVSVKAVSIRSSNGKRQALVEVSASEKGLAIGKNGRNIDMIKRIVNRHHNIDDVILQ